MVELYAETWLIPSRHELRVALNYGFEFMTIYLLVVILVVKFMKGARKRR